MKIKYTHGFLKLFWIGCFALTLLNLNSCGGEGNSSFQIDRALNWFGTHTEDGATTTNFAFLVESQSGDSITGIIAWNGLGPAVYTDFTGTISGMDITLSWVQDSTSINLKGTIDDEGAKMTGTWTSSDGTSGAWEAIGHRVVAA